MTYVRGLLIGVWILTLGPIAAGSVAAQPARLLADLNRAEPVVPFDPRFFDIFGAFRPPRYSAALGASILFDAEDNEHGWELWISDGTTESTRLLADLNPGLPDGNPRELTTLGDRVLFSAEDGSWGRELWVTDGTAEGTRRLTDIAPVAESAFVQDLKPGFGGVLFVARFNVCVCEVWLTDGTAAGTVRLWRPAPHLGVTEPVRILAVGDDYVLLAVATADGGYEPWALATDSSAERLADIHPGPAGSLFDFTRAEAFDGGFAFDAFEPARGFELWHTRGSPQTTRLLADTVPGGENALPIILGTSGGDLLIALTPAIAADPVLARIDAGGNLTTVVDQQGQPVRHPSALGAVNGDLVLAAETPPPPGEFQAQYRVFLASGPTLIDGLPSAPDGPAQDSDVIWFRVVSLDGSLPSTHRVWRTDGTAEGTFPVSPEFETPLDDAVEPVRYSGNIMRYAGGALYAVPAYPRIGNALWRLDKDDPATTSLLLETYRPVSSSEVVLWHTSNASVFVSGLVTPGLETLWQYHTDAGQLAQVAEAMRFFSGPPFRFLDWNGAVFIQAAGDPGNTGLAHPLLRADPDAPGDVVVVLDGALNWPSNLALSRGAMWFVVQGLGTGMFEIWRSDGTRDGTRVAVEVPGQRAFLIPQLGGLVDHLVFEFQRTLWRSDGTPEGTEPLSGVANGPLELPHAFQALPGEALFRATSPTRGAELWRTDGTGAGTRLLADLNPGPGSSQAILLATDGESTLVDYRSVGQRFLGLGTLNGDRYRPLPGTELEPLQDCLRNGSRRRVVASNDGVHGNEPTLYDCVSRRRTLLADLVPGPRGSNPLAITMVGTTAYYSAWHPDTGRELYRTDLVTGETDLAADIVPGPGSSNPGVTFRQDAIFRLGRWLVFAADDGNGVELWGLELPRVGDRNLRNQELP